MSCARRTGQRGKHGRKGDCVTRINFVDLGRQYEALREEVEPAVLSALASCQYILGEEVATFEREWASYCGVERAVGVSSGTSALQLAYDALGVGPGDEVIAPANTFIATILPLFRLGATPVLVDCNEFGQIDVAGAAAAITPRTKAIVGVHLFGHPCDAPALAALCDDHGIAFVEDAAQAHGAEVDGRRCGSFGRVAAFSFYPGKNLGAYGDAGAVVTSDEEIADRLKILRDLGQARKYEHVAIGGNERLDTVQAAVLRVKLRHLDDWTARRRAHAASFDGLLDGAVETPRVAEGANPVWHLYVIGSDLRPELQAALEAADVATGLHYPTPLHLQPALAQLGYAEGDFPESELRARRSLSLPMFPELRPDEIEHIAEVVRSVAHVGVAD
jgi:dTDP-4-amino-4,6-dideoxygalactose transaminase